MALVAGPRKTRLTPINAASANSTGRLASPARLTHASTSAMPVVISSAQTATIRRSNRSATTPAIGESSTIGTNCTSPSSPSWNEAPAMLMP